MSATNGKPLSELIMSFAIPALLSAFSSAATIAYFLGGANQDMRNMSQIQVEQGKKIENLNSVMNSNISSINEKISNLDKGQGVMAVEIRNISDRLRQTDSTVGKVREDMQCIRIVVVSGNMTKC